MGTDIHLYVERRNGSGWESCDQWDKDENYPDRVSVPYYKHFYDARSYDTFAILADVRNGYGFAGADTGDGFIPISEPKGLPDDMSLQLAEEAAAMLEHTPTWLTLRELMDYDWTRVTKKRGWVNGPQLKQWSSYERQRGHGPSSWCGGIDGPRIEKITEDEMHIRIKNVVDLFKGRDWQEMESALVERLGHAYCQVSWEIPYYRAASEFLSDVIPRLWRLGAPDDVRIVFWFDS